MTRHKLTPEERAKRNKARWEIIQTANRHKMRDRQHPFHYPTLYGMKNIQLAVHHVRQFMLASPDLLRRAGFTPKALKPKAPRKLSSIMERIR